MSISWLTRPLPVAEGATFGSYTRFIEGADFGEFVEYFSKMHTKAFG